MSASSRPVADADLHAFVDGQMDFERRAVMVQAMASDPELRARVDQWRRQNEALTASFGGVLREPVPLRLMPTNLGRTGKTQSPEKPAAPQARSPARPPYSSRRVAAIALAAFLAGGGMVFLADALTSVQTVVGTARPAEIAAPFGPPAFALRAYEAHQTYATDFAHPVEVSAGDQVHLLKWLQHRLSMAIRLPDLRRSGWTLIGGRVLPGELGPAAFLLYGNGVERLGLYMARTNARQADGMAVYDNGASLGSVASWVDEPVGYALTANRDAAWWDRDGMALYRSVEAQSRDNASSE